MIWVRNIVLGVVALFVLFVIVSIVVFYSSGGGSRTIEDQDPTATNCAGLPTPPGADFLDCVYE